MNQSEVESFVSSLDNVQQTEAFGYTFYFVGDDHRLPFLTIADSDNEYDRVSNLSRDGVFRVNLGVSKETFEQLLPDADQTAHDFSVLNTFLPHPDYAKQHFLCILSPLGANAERLKSLIQEAHGTAKARFERNTRENA